MSKWFSLIGMFPVLFLAGLTFPVSSSDFSAIENPKPNIVETEKHFVRLEKMKTIDADLGNGDYLFRPFSMTVCRSSSDVFIYDNLQAKIFKLDPELAVVKTSFGGKGAGPGEFGGTGKLYPVYIHMGGDNRLYANDFRMRKIIVFDENGKYIRELKNMGTKMKEPLVDSSGNLHILTVKDKIINVHDEKKTLLYTLSNQKDNFNYLFSTPAPLYLKMVSQFPEGDLLAALTLDSRYLLYFPSSSTMVILENKKVSGQMRLWPHEALNSYKTKLAEVRKKYEGVHIEMFSNLFVDEDNDHVFFLQFGRDERKGINALYQFNDSGQLMKVLFVKFNEKSPRARFKLKKDDRFYAIEGDKIAVYKEVKNK